MNELISYTELSKIKNEEIKLLKDSYLNIFDMSINSTRDYTTITHELIYRTHHINKNFKRRLKKIGYIYIGYVVVDHVKLSKDEFSALLRTHPKGNFLMDKEIYGHKFKKEKLIN